MRQLGRILQHLGLILLPLGIIFELFGVVSLGQMLLAVVPGICLFAIGRLIEGYGGE